MPKNKTAPLSSIVTVFPRDDGRGAVNQFLFVKST